MEEETTEFGNALLTWTVIGILVFSLLFLLRQWIKGAKFTEKVGGHGRVAIVTGANSGIGKQLTRELVMRHVRVYMVCRSVERGRQAKQQLVMDYGCSPDKMVVMEADLCSFRSIRDFVTEFSKVESYLDILVNNAGVMFYPRFELTEDGWETTWQSNYLGHFLLTELLRPALEASYLPSGARVVNVSSLAQGFARSPPTPELVNDPKRFDRFIGQTYARSKLAQVMHAVELTKRLREENPASKVTVNACHPGAVYTNLPRDFPCYGRLIEPYFRPLIWFFLKTANDGAQTPLYLALSRKIEGASGKYFSDCVERPDRVNAIACSPEHCERLYNWSLEACGLAE